MLKILLFLVIFIICSFILCSIITNRNYVKLMKTLEGFNSKSKYFCVYIRLIGKNISIDIGMDKFMATRKISYSNMYEIYGPFNAIFNSTEILKKEILLTVNTCEINNNEKIDIESYIMDRKLLESLIK